MVKIYSRYDVPPKKGLEFSKPSKTFQEFKNECDLNIILNKASRGLIDLTKSDKKPIYGDFTQIGSYQDNLNKVILAEKMFEELPSAVRERFKNNPQKLIDFVNDENNYDEAVKLGLCNKKSAVAVTGAPVSATVQPVTSKSEENIK